MYPIAQSPTLAYIVGIALGDGNLSNPNGRATRLRITCDTRYPNLISEIQLALKHTFPKNAVSLVRTRKGTYCNISVYSNNLEKVLPWKVGHGGKAPQHAHVPTWILKNDEYVRTCLKGLLQTDGSIYNDRGYLMINFVNHTKELAEDVHRMITLLGFSPTLSIIKERGRSKYTVRLVKDSEKFIKMLDLRKD